MSNLKPIIEESFSQYAGAVLQSRALVDVRDCLKPSARQIFYSMLSRKLISSNKYKKTANAVGMAMADFYIHGDSSCLGIIMRAGQPFNMRYPLMDVKGNMGTQIKTGDWAASRYTESRLSKLSDVFFKDIDKDTISEWRENYDDTKEYPSVLPTKGFYNIVNGTMGIGIGMSSSIPQFNINDVNSALITLIENPDCSFEDIYCAPDFATGGYLLNEEEVKESLRNGTGSSCRLRSLIEYDNKERCFIVTEIPYGVYTNTICKEIDAIIEDDDNNPGIDKYNDLTGKTPLIKIYLSKRGNPDRILKYLYKNTSLQSWYSINMTMLDNGRFPKVFTWKEALQAHLNHEKEVYIRGFKYDLNKIEKRLHIIEGYLVALANIEEVIYIIKTSNSTFDANKKLCENFKLDEEQAKAILNMKLSRLAHLEVEKIEKEKKDLEKEQQRIINILNNEVLLNKEIEDELRNIMKKFGDERRTKILNISEEDKEPVEIRQLSLSYTNKNAIFITETSSLYLQKRNGVGSKFKLEKGEYVVDSLLAQTNDKILFFTEDGKVFHKNINEFAVGEKEYLDLERICAATILTKENQNKNLVFLTRKGMLKKSKLTEYNLKRKTGSVAISLDEDDVVVSAIIMEEEDLGILTRLGNFIWIKTNNIKPIGRVAKGVKGIKLNKDDYVVSSKTILPTTNELLSISDKGNAKRTNIKEFKITGRATKGLKIQKAELLCDFLPIENEKEVLIISNNAQLKVKLSDIPLLSKGCQGVKSIKLNENLEVIGLVKI